MSQGNSNQADQVAFERMLNAEPLWDGIEKAESALGLDDRLLLHAGPPISSVGTIAKPVLNSMVLAAVFEGWSENVEEAENSIENGDIVLRPAQELNAVVPLAAVLSSSMFVHRVRDKNSPDRVAYSPFNGGMGAAMRLGLRDQAVIEHWRWLNDEFAAQLQTIQGLAIPLIPLADHSLLEGDDCHGRTQAATAELLEQIAGRLSDKETLPARQYIADTPPFFLNLWMAASKCMMMAAAGTPDSAIVTAIAGNGVEMGIQVAGLPGRWFVAEAEPPCGALQGSYQSSDRLGAIGDSAVVDAVGLGAMAFQFAPEQVKTMRNALPEDWNSLPDQMLWGRHPKFERSQAMVGLSAKRVVDKGKNIIISLGILDRLGKGGRIGGGIYRPSLEPFRAACAALRGP